MPKRGPLSCAGLPSSSARLDQVRGCICAGPYHVVVLQTLASNLSAANSPGLGGVRISRVAETPKLRMTAATISQSSSPTFFTRNTLVASLTTTMKVARDTKIIDTITEYPPDTILPTFWGCSPAEIPPLECPDYQTAVEMNELHVSLIRLSHAGVHVAAGNAVPAESRDRREQ